MKLLPSKDTIFLCTTYFDCPKRDSWQMFQQGINGILKYHNPQILKRIDKWVVVNEYMAKPRANWAKLIHQQYPFITFLQKSEQDAGQVKSLNILLEYITPYKYWFHWEEGWVPTRPFLSQAFNIMDDTEITQLQLTKNPSDKFDWMTRTTEPKTCMTDFCIIHHSQILDENLGMEKVTTKEKIFRYWPLYSLQPSFNRVSFYTFGNFSTKKFPSPVVSEYDFGQRWYRHGGVKAVLKDGALVRPNNYVSTHD